MDIKLNRTELEVRNVTETEDVKTIIVGLLGATGHNYQLRELAESLARYSGKAVGLAAGADSDDTEQRDYSGSLTTQIEAKLGKLSFKITKVHDIQRDIQNVRRISVTNLAAAAADPYQQVIDFSEADTVYLLEAGAVFEYDYDECAQVLDAHPDGTFTVAQLYATGIAPKKFSGDLAQTSILINGAQEQVLGLSEWSLDWTRKTVEATDTDSAAYESHLGSTKGWTGKAKFMYIDGDQSQVDAILSVIDTFALDAVTWNFFPTPEASRAAFQGDCIVDRMSFATGMGKILGTDVSLKGTGPLKRLVQSAPIANPSTVTGISAQVPV